MLLRPILLRYRNRHKAPETSPVTLGQDRIFILPTAIGGFFALVLLLMYIGAVNYNLSLGHALVYLMLALALVTLLHCFYNLLGLEISVRPACPVFAGEYAEFPIELISRNARARQEIVLQKIVLQNLHESAACTVPAQGSRSILLKMHSRQRGWLELDRLHLSSTFPLGLFRAWARPALAGRCLIYPKPIFIALPQSPTLRPEGTHDRRPQHEDFAGFRIRQPEDSLHHVAWKAYARAPDSPTRSLKVFSGEQTDALELSWFDLPPTLNVEDKLAILCGWVLQAAQCHAPYSLTLPDRHIARQNGDQHRDTCLQALACYPQHG